MTENNETVELEVLHETRGRIVLAEPDGTVYLGRGYEVHRSNDDGATWAKLFSLPRSPLRRAAELLRLSSRLLRQEIRALARHPDDIFVASNRQGVFHGPAGSGELKASRVDVGDIHLRPPMRINCGPDGTVVWGEYGPSREGKPVRLFASQDRGESFHVVHTFEGGDIGHVHNVVYSDADGHYWVLVGDHGPHPGIGRLSTDFSRFEWVARGEQECRTTEVFEFGKHLVYGMDTEMTQSGVVRLDKETGQIERIRDLDGSCIYACRFGGIYALSTSVEPSEVIQTDNVDLWLSRDGVDWKRAFRDQKDAWSAKYFQFGSIVLPSGATNRDVIYFSGQATRRLDGKLIVARVASGSAL